MGAATNMKSFQSTFIPLFLLNIGIFGNFIPEFVPKDDVQVIRLLEGSATPVGRVIHRFKGSDYDGDPVTFRIRGLEDNSNISTVFRLDRVSNTDAQIVLKKELDRELTEDYMIEATITDGRTPSPKLRTQAMLFIVVDVNDNSPKFVPFNGTVYIPENSGVPQVIAEMQAEDADEGPNGNVTYFMDVDQGDRDKFSMTVVQNKVYIHLLKALDYEAKSQYKMQVVAKDTPLEEKYTRETTATITISVTDVDDNGPVFVSAPPVTQIREDVPPLTETCRVQAVDGDSGMNSKILYELLNELDKFEIDSTAGVIKTRAHLDYEGSVDGAYTLRIKATEVESVRTPKPSVEASIVISLIDVDERPRFKNETYRGSIPENSPPGFPVMLFSGYVPEVYDNDLGGKSLIRLSIEGDGDTFAVSPTQGHTKVAFSVLVKNPLRLDYERLQEIVFHLIAEDTFGNRTLVQFSVLITDVNDNSPVFNEDNYFIRIMENPSQGHQLITVQATDTDSGLFGSKGIRYTDLQGYGADRFSLDVKTGEIVITKEDSVIFDRERHAFIYLTVVARDNNGNGNGNMTLVTIQLLDVNDNAPTFIQSRFETEVSENVRNALLPIRLSATDADEPGTNNSKVSFVLSPTTYANHVQVDQFTGEVRIVKAFDFEGLAEQFGAGELVVAGKRFRLPLNITVETHDKGNPPLFTKANLTLFILDENDCAPTFPHLSFNISVEEDLRRSSSRELVTLEAQDSDVSPLYNKLEYRISSGNEAFKFRLNSTTGVLSLAPGASLDYDSNSHYKLHVSAVDRLGLQSDHDCIVNVEVKDVNNKPPTFLFEQSVPQDQAFQCGGEARLYYGILKENTPPGKVITKVAASDPDTNASILYTIDFRSVKVWKDGRQVNVSKLNFEVYLEMDHASGKISTGSVPFDHELMDRVTVLVKVEDRSSSTGLQEDVATLLIDIVNVIDKKPSFTSDTYAISVYENSKLDTPVLSVTAKGEDDTGQKSMRYSILNSTNSSIPFSIDSITGVVTVTGNIDREITPWINFTLKASDEEASSSLFTLAEIFAEVKDVNDNVPKFTNLTKIVKLKENLPKGTLVTVVEARDADTGSFGKVIYSLSEVTNSFSINSTTGEVRTTRALDREQLSTHKIKITVRDNPDMIVSQDKQERVFHTEVKWIEVQVEDENDEVPRFILHPGQNARVKLSSHDVYTVKDDFEGLIASFSLVDGDDPSSLNSVACAHINSGENETHLFQLKMDNSSVWGILTNQSLHGHVGKYTVLVNTEDGGVPPNKVSKEFHIVVQASSPSNETSSVTTKFSQGVYTAVIYEGDKVGQPLLQLSATQTVSEGGSTFKSAANLTFHLERLVEAHLQPGSGYNFSTSSNQDFFTVNASSGVLALNFDVNATAVGYFEGTVGISDSETEGQIHDRATVRVFFADIESTIDFETRFAVHEAQQLAAFFGEHLQNLLHFIVHTRVFHLARNGSSETSPGEKSRFQVVVICPLTYLILGSATTRLSIHDLGDCKEFDNIVNEFKIVNFKRNLRPKSDKQWYDADKLQLDYFIVGLTIGAIMGVILVSCCCTVRFTKLKRKYEKDPAVHLDSLSPRGYEAEKVSFEEDFLGPEASEC